MRVTLAQINPVVGDIDGNLARILSVVRDLHGGTELVVFPELCLCGYPPRDLLERSGFVAAAGAALQELAAASTEVPGIGIVVGFPRTVAAGGRGVANAAALVVDGAVKFIQEKTLLPTYDVFDEARYFDAARTRDVVTHGAETLGITICEDAWNDPVLFPGRLYAVDPMAEAAALGATLMVNISASPFTVGRERVRIELLRNHARRHGVPIVFVNQVGGNDELVFDGRSLVIDADGELLAALPMFEESITTVDLNAQRPIDHHPMEEVESVRGALVLGVRDYLRKCGFDRAVVGLSGGIDSAVTMAIAVEALGADKVLGVAMPSPHSSRESLDDARVLARNFGVALREIPIAGIMKTFGESLSPLFSGMVDGVAEENIQARIRGNLLMAISNKLGHLLLTTGNKSELAVGYCTLYGDMSGGLAVLSDVPKIMVYQIAALYNAMGEKIPASIITKAPSAELRPGQKDSDTLPPYEILDGILDLYIEGGHSANEIVARGFDRSTVSWVTAAVRASEYKRRQAAPGIKVTSKAFGVGRRFPVAARYKV